MSEQENRSPELSDRMDVAFDSHGTVAWWELESPVATLVGLVRTLLSDDMTRRSLYRVWDDLYEGQQLFAGTNPQALAVISAEAGMDSNTFNFAGRATDFVHAKVTSETPTVRAVSHGADYDEYLRAQALSDFVRGMFEQLSLATHMPRSVLSALRTGTGCVQALVRDGVPSIEVVHPRELLVDPDDARHGDPRALYRVRPVDRRALMADHPEHAGTVSSAGATNETDGMSLGRRDDWGRGRTHVSDAVDLFEAWVLPRGDEPGRHVACVDHGEPLIDEPWESPRFPVSFLRMRDPNLGCGFWGHGLVERLDAAQFRIDSMVSHVARSLEHANLKVFVNDASEIVEDGILDDPTVGTIIRMSGEAVPHFVTPAVLGPEVMGVLTQWVSWLYQLAGMDETVASSQKPGGVDSAIAIRTYHDFQSQTYVDLIKRYSRHVVEVVERLLDQARLISETNPDWEVRYARGEGSGATRIRWSDVDMDRDSFVIELQEASPVPDTITGALQEVEEDAAAGRIPQEYLTRLREQPDRWWEARRNAKADVDFVEWVISRLLDPRAPEPELRDEMDKQLAIDSLRREVLTSVRLGRPPEVVRRLEDFSFRLAESMAPPPPDDDGSGGVAPAMAPPPMGGPMMPQPGPVGPAPTAMPAG